MQTAKHAIKVTRVADGWTWTLLDGRGGAAAQGAAPRQQEAMETAWRAAKAFARGRRTAFPDIIVEQRRTEH
jgi:hypothetical protein